MEKTGKASFFQQVGSLPSNFWFANIMEMLERLAFYGVRAVAPLYLVASSGQNGLGLDYKQKGVIYTVWALLQCLIPMVSGGYTDRYGYRKSLAVAFGINILGYVGMAQAKPLADALTTAGWQNAGFWVFMLAACLVATGTAIFKPPVQATIARSVTDDTSSMGWGFFYWVVNIGGALGPIAAATLRLEIDWHRVFYAAAVVTALNFLPAFLLYREPPRDFVEASDRPKKGPVGVFWTSIVTIFRDLRLVAFLGIFSCFWLMFMQLWDLLPNFIDEWVDSSGVAPYFAWFSEDWVLASGQVKPEMIINLDSISIIALVIFISWLIRRISKVAAMIIGMVISLVGFVGAGATALGWLCCLMIFVFSIGEMMCSPTFSAYVGLIAPKDRKALYMGYSNIPYAIGWASGGLIGNFVYEATANKFKLARQYLVDHLGMSPDFVLDEGRLPKDRVMETMARAMETGDGPALQERLAAAWGQVDPGAAGDQLNERVIAALDGVLGTVEPAGLQTATRALWDLHHPYLVWYYLGAVGLVGIAGMIVFYLVTRRTRQELENGGTAA